MAIDKNQPALLEWMVAVEKSIHAKLEASEEAVVANMK
jgi:hypothetical protein